MSDNYNKIILKIKNIFHKSNWSLSGPRAINFCNINSGSESIFYEYILEQEHIIFHLA